MQSASLLNVLEAELADQVEESLRPPFETVEAIGDHVDISNPKPSESSALHMCVGRITDTPKLVRLELINGGEAENVESIMTALDKLDTQRRSKFVFSLTAWKQKNRSVFDNPQYFQVGGVYLFPKVHAVRRYFNLLQGSTQLNPNASPQRVYPTLEQGRGGDNGGADGIGTTTENPEPPNALEPTGACEDGTIVSSELSPGSRRGVVRRRDEEPEPEVFGVSTEPSCAQPHNPSPLKRNRSSLHSSVK
ncbi:hypothetical protein DVH05_000191 [Phytophthora capsici]|nr:hypothetical protein DVH05_000191 [Phytophthora capsici]